jgi:RimJ/RimL family protein N-acetyltransferase
VLTGRAVVLREIRRTDLEVIHRELYADVATSVLAGVDPWVPPLLARREARFDRALAEPEDEKRVMFAVSERSDEHRTLVGTVGLWGIDLHNSLAHIGLSLVPSVRGRGLATDALRVICYYGFVVRGLHRLALETLGSNEPMRRAALSAGFVEEGRLRESAFVLGERDDDVLLGLLRSEWQPDDGSVSFAR